MPMFNALAPHNGQQVRFLAAHAVGTGLAAFVAVARAAVSRKAVAEHIRRSHVNVEKHHERGARHESQRCVTHGIRGVQE